MLEPLKNSETRQPILRRSRAAGEMVFLHERRRPTLLSFVKELIELRDSLRMYCSPLVVAFVYIAGRRLGADFDHVEPRKAQNSRCAVCAKLEQASEGIEKGGDSTCRRWSPDQILHFGSIDRSITFVLISFRC